jgi:hypothetical protein
MGLTDADQAGVTRTVNAGRLKCDKGCDVPARRDDVGELVRDEPLITKLGGLRG